ncbi:MAG: hypothetical protein J5933_04735 [Clostridia bacterium]|nr:hypothetical protein [Clostridia bacterium]
MNTFRLKVISPDNCFFDGEAVNLSLRAAEGDLAVMAGHIPLVTTVRPCDFSIETDRGEVLEGRTEGGILNVTTDCVTLMSASFS